MLHRRLRGWQPPLENINSLVASGGPRLLARGHPDAQQLIPPVV